MGRPLKKQSRCTEGKGEQQPVMRSPVSVATAKSARDGDDGENADMVDSRDGAAPVLHLTKAQTHACETPPICSAFVIKAAKVEGLPMQTNYTNNDRQTP